MQQNVLITGGTSGIGLATAMRFAEQGARLIVNGRNAERGAEACAAVRAHYPDADIEFIAADLSEQDEAASLMQGSATHFGGTIHVLVNSAGGDFTPALFHETDLQTIERVVRHWLLSAMFSCRCALPHMATGSAIVNVASDAAKVPTPGETVIGAALAGITMFSRTLAMEAKRQGIRVNVVTPSLVANTRTHARITAGGFSAKLFEKAARAAHLGVPEPEDVADLIIFLAGPQAKRITGQVVSVNGGISAG
ncbi:SDR family NAD(P)-dependent oxidoreductase [Rhodoligotrophos ferricapiens]|uniref:SDR family NAD(P)-dependent oxidoreductase n=1 Tax=Rhodoligotrophos ferricapiens TaxID=3069264 RepID=UPI00315DA9C2